MEGWKQPAALLKKEIELIMMRSLYSGVSGLKNHQTRMDVIGNNIANVNTTGFKGSRVTFQDMLSQTLTGASSPQGNRGGTNPQQIGLGMTVASIDTIFSDGSVQSTGKNTDIAISGNGFFIMSDGDKEYYTRNGAFEFDTLGNYVLPGSGLHVKGWMADAEGNVSTSGPITNIVVPTGQTMAAKATTKATASGNLSAEAPVGYIFTMNATATKDMKVGDSVYDKQGNVIGTVTIAGLAGQNFTFKTKDVAINPPTEIYDAGTHIFTGSALTTVTASTTHLYSVASAAITLASGVTVAVGDEVKLGGRVIGKVKTFDAGPPPTISYETTVPLGSPPTAASNITVGVASSVVSLGSATTESSYFTMKASAVRDMKVGDSIYDGTGTNVIGTVTVAAVAGSEYTFTTNAIPRAGNPSVDPVAPLAVTDGKGTPANPVINVPAGNFVSKEGGKTNSQLMSFAAFDSQGIKHTVSGYLVKAATNEWIFTPTSPATSGATVSTDPISLKFDANGNLLNGSGAVTITPVDPPLGSNVVTVTLDFAGMKQYAGETNISVDKDGNAAGTLDEVSTDTAGMIVGSFSNGLKKNLGRVALATFNNPSGLTKSGSSLYSQSNNSGEVRISTAGNGGAGSLSPSSIEMSNVNLSDQFSDMIVTQRGFQSNSKIITVSDEMIETLVNLKR